jgi:hypothetical protein
MRLGCATFAAAGTCDQIQASRGPDMASILGSEVHRLTAEVAVIGGGTACPYRKSNPNILVMQPTQNRTAKNVTDGPYGARYGRILL